MGPARCVGGRPSVTLAQQPVARADPAALRTLPADRLARKLRADASEHLRAALRGLCRPDLTLTLSLTLNLSLSLSLSLTLTLTRSLPTRPPTRSCT